MSARILFVDDEPKILQGLGRMLRGMRHEWDLLFANGGPEAFELMGRSRVDVVVSDMRMPGMDGAELLAEVEKRHPHTVQFVLSGQTDKETAFRAVGPSHHFLSKPCEADILVNSVRRALGTTHAEVGAYLIGLWGLSDVIVESIAYHHTPLVCATGVSMC